MVTELPSHTIDGCKVTFDLRLEQMRIVCQEQGKDPTIDFFNFGSAQEESISDALDIIESIKEPKQFGGRT